MLRGSNVLCFMSAPWRPSFLSLKPEEGEVSAGAGGGGVQRRHAVWVAQLTTLAGLAGRHEDILKKCWCPPWLPDC